MAGGARVICPDCYSAKISQEIQLKNKRCPDCGGKYKRGEWKSAPKYPTSFNSYEDLMSVSVSNARKIAGVWKSRDIRHIG